LVFLSSLDGRLSMAVPNAGGPRAVVSVCGGNHISHNNVHLVVGHPSDRLSKSTFGIRKSEKNRSCVIQRSLCPRHSKNGGGALSVTPVRAFVRASVRPLSKFGVRSITFERLHRFNSNLVC